MNKTTNKQQTMNLHKSKMMKNNNNNKNNNNSQKKFQKKKKKVQKFFKTFQQNTMIMHFLKQVKNKKKWLNFMVLIKFGIN